MNNAYDWPYVLKPRWVHDLLLLWRRKQPYDLYIERVTDYSVAEVRDEAMRRRYVAWMAHHFVPSRAGYTLSQNVWASYSHHFLANELAPAFLACLILREPLARQITAAMHEHIYSGMSIHRTLLCDVPAAPGALEALLRTFAHWGVLAADPRQGGYVVDGRLCVAAPIFPLLVWLWWLDARQPHVALEEFREMPLWTWMETEDFGAGWQRYAGRLWTLETAGGVPTAYLHPTDTTSFARLLLNLLSTDGRSGRQWPRHGDEPRGDHDGNHSNDGPHEDGNDEDGNDEDASVWKLAAVPVVQGR